jgi:hypothetical protein
MQPSAHWPAWILMTTLQQKVSISFAFLLFSLFSFSFYLFLFILFIVIYFILFYFYLFYFIFFAVNLHGTANLPPVESFDVWPLISGVNSTGPRSTVCLFITRRINLQFSLDCYWRDNGN